MKMKKMCRLIAFALCAVFSAVAFSATPVNINWTYSAADVITYGVDGFIVEKKSEACADTVASWHELTVVQNSLRTFTDSAVIPGATYCYRVFSRGVAGKSAASNTAEKTILGPPPAPTNVTATG
jgi:hypothetical protein